MEKMVIAIVIPVEMRNRIHQTLLQTIWVLFLPHHCRPVHNVPEPVHLPESGLLSQRKVLPELPAGDNERGLGVEVCPARLHEGE